VFGEVKALGDAGAECVQAREGLGVLDAFGHGGESEALAEGDDRLDDRGVGGVGREVAHERAVDLELGDGQA
jgi:hypothetical protein